MANPKAPYLHNADEHCIIFPFDVNGKVINIKDRFNKCVLDEASLILASE